MVKGRESNSSGLSTVQLYFSAEDVRQFAYCPRKIYYRYVLRNDWLLSPKMKKGTELHEILCRRKNNEKIGNVERYYNLRLQDDDLRLFALIDIVEWDGEEGRVIELKTGSHKGKSPNFPDKLQVVAEALLVEFVLGIPVTVGSVWYYKKNEVIDFEISYDDKFKVINMLKKMKKIVESELFPDVEGPTKKCRDCECRRLCWWVE